MSKHLERILAQFLKVNRRECCDPNKQKYYKHQHDYFKDWNMNCLGHFLCKKVAGNNNR